MMLFFNGMKMIF